MAVQPIERNGIMTHRASTRHVIRNLENDTASEESRGIVLANQDLEGFIQDAKSWLGDRSELGTFTLDTADWVEVHQYFRELGGYA